MRTVAEKAVERSIATMRERFSEDLTTDDLARSAMFSKFHFSRVFTRITGVSPGKFLSAIRLQEAKRLLTTTNLTVAAISGKVGYTSVSTFTSRFTRSVGLPPNAYRRYPRAPGLCPNQFCAPAGDRAIRGHLREGQARPHGRVFLGLFPDCIAEGHPASWTVLDEPGPYQLPITGPGSWFLVAQSIGPCAADGRPDQPSAIAREGPLVVRRDSSVERVDVTLRRACPFDPPALAALVEEARVTSVRPPAAAPPRPATGDPPGAPTPSIRPGAPS